MRQTFFNSNLSPRRFLIEDSITIMREQNVDAVKALWIAVQDVQKTGSDRPLWAYIHQGRKSIAERAGNIVQVIESQKAREDRQFLFERTYSLYAVSFELARRFMIRDEAGTPWIRRDYGPENADLVAKLKEAYQLLNNVREEAQVRMRELNPDA